MERHRWSRALTEPLARRLEAAVAESADFSTGAQAARESAWEFAGADMATALRRASRRAGPAMKCPTCSELTPLQDASGPAGNRSLLCFGCGIDLLPPRHEDRNQPPDD